MKTVCKNDSTCIRTKIHVRSTQDKGVAICSCLTVVLTSLALFTCWSLAQFKKLFLIACAQDILVMMYVVETG